MSFKNKFILIIVCVLFFYLFNEKKDLFAQILEKINLKNNEASLTTEKIDKTIRIYNGHPSGESLPLKKDTKLLSKADGLVYKSLDVVVVPGVKDGKPGHADVRVETVKKKDTKIDEESIITIPGLSSTDYFETTWVELINDKDNNFSSKEEGISVRKTFVNGIIEKDTIWEIEKSPYIITGNIFIPENVTLLVEPGVEIIFDGDYGFLIEGEMKMIGKKKKPIKF